MPPDKAPGSTQGATAAAIRTPPRKPIHAGQPATKRWRSASSAQSAAGVGAVQERASSGRRPGKIADLDEILTFVWPVLTPPIQRGRPGMPSVEGDQAAGHQRSAAPGRVLSPRFGCGTEVGAGGPTQRGQPARRGRGHWAAGEFLVFGQAPPARPTLVNEQPPVERPSKPLAPARCRVMGPPPRTTASPAQERILG
jgi:hypothetical protein